MIDIDIKVFQINYVDNIVFNGYAQDKDAATSIIESVRKRIKVIFPARVHLRTQLDDASYCYIIKMILVIRKIPNECEFVLCIIAHSETRHSKGLIDTYFATCACKS